MNHARWSVLVLIAMFGATIVTAREEPVRTDAITVRLASPRGEALVCESEHRSDLFRLCATLETQENLGYCGIASSVTVLNALPVDRPTTENHGAYRLFTQTNFFIPEVSAVKSADRVRRSGLTLDQLGKMLSAHGVSARVVHAEPDQQDDLRKAVMKAMQSDREFVLANYLRSSIGQKTGGHISPIGAYNKEVDRYLILDVARFKYPPVWVRAGELWAAMRAVDSDSAKSRGFVVVGVP